LVENKKHFDLRKALNLMAKVQPIKVEDDVIDEVSMCNVLYTLIYCY
jgi:hypothetical protein